MSVMDVLPKIILAILVFIIIWLLASLVRQGIRDIFRVLKVDKGLSYTGLDETMRNAGFRLDSGLFVGELLRWFLIILGLQLALTIVGLSQVGGFLTSLYEYIPNVIVAAIVVIAGALVAQVVERLVAGSARAASLGSGRGAGLVAKYAVWVFVGFAAISQLQILNTIIQPILWGIIAMLSLTGGLAFGLGGRDWAAKKLHDWSAQK